MKYVQALLLFRHHYLVDAVVDGLVERPHVLTDEHACQNSGGVAVSYDERILLFSHQHPSYGLKRLRVV